MIHDTDDQVSKFKWFIIRIVMKATRFPTNDENDVQPFDECYVSFDL